MCQALTMMLEEERKVGIKEGKIVGIREGKADGLREGKADGLREGKAVGLREGKAVGLREGKASSILDLLSEHSPVPEALSNRILAENDLSILTNWLKLAAKSSTLDDFTKNM